MATKLKQGDMLVSLSSDNDMGVAVSVPETVAGFISPDIKLFVYKPLDMRKDEPALKGEDYPALVQAWDNEQDDIFDTL